MYFRLSGLQSSFLFIHFSEGPNTCLHRTIYSLTQKLFDMPTLHLRGGPGATSRRNPRWCVWTEALSGIVLVPAQKISGIVWTFFKTWAKLFLMKEYMKFKFLNCGIKIFNKMGPWQAGNKFQFPGLFSFQNLGYQIWNLIIRAVVVRKPMLSLWINQRYWLILACVAAGLRIV